MSRKREIGRGFYTDEDLAERSVWARLLFPGLWQIADREGRLDDRPSWIRIQVFPYDNLEAVGVSVNELLNELAQPKRHSQSSESFIVRYEADGRRFIQIVNFKKHQHPHPNEPKSEIPPPPKVAKNSLADNRGATEGQPSAQAMSSVPSVSSKPSMPSRTDPPQTDAAPPDALTVPGEIPPEESVALARAHVLAEESVTLAEPLPWNREAAELWWQEYKGQPPGAFFKALKPAVRKYTWERVRPALVTYMAETPAEYVNVAKFVSCFGTWEARARGTRAPPQPSEKARARDEGDMAMILAGMKGDGSVRRDLGQGNGGIEPPAGAGRDSAAQGGEGPHLPARARRSVG